MTFLVFRRRWMDDARALDGRWALPSTRQLRPSPAGGSRARCLVPSSTIEAQHRILGGLTGYWTPLKKRDAMGMRVLTAAQAAGAMWSCRLVLRSSLKACMSAAGCEAPPARSGRPPRRAAGASATHRLPPRCSAALQLSKGCSALDFWRLEGS